MRTYLRYPVYAVIISVCIAGCVRRTATFTTEPKGAHVYLNDRPIGATPATVDFTWYGDYDVVYRMEGYETEKTHVRLKPPIYQRFPLDLFFEILWPWELHDHHDVPTLQLTQKQPTEESELSERALEMRDRALYEGQ